MEQQWALGHKSHGSEGIKRVKDVPSVGEFISTGMDSALHLVKCAGNVEARTILQNSVLLSKT